MQYTKGIRGPESSNKVDIQYLKVEGTPNNPMAKGTMLVHLFKGPRMVRFMAQGKNAKALIDTHRDIGATFGVTMRWTARDAVTITGVDLVDKIQKAA